MPLLFGVALDKTESIQNLASGIKHALEDIFLLRDEQCIDGPVSGTWIDGWDRPLEKGILMVIYPRQIIYR